MINIRSLPPSTQPGDALAAVVVLRRLADQLERKSIQQALAQGWTWAQIAEVLGVTRQAAHKRHAAAVVRSPTAQQGDTPCSNV